MLLGAFSGCGGTGTSDSSSASGPLKELSEVPEYTEEKKMWIGSSFLTTTNTKIQVNTLFINLLPNNQIYDTNVGLYFEKTLI